MSESQVPTELPGGKQGAPAGGGECSGEQGAWDLHGDPLGSRPRAAAMGRPRLPLYCTLDNTERSKFAQRKQSALINSTQKWENNEVIF